MREEQAKRKNFCLLLLVLFPLLVLPGALLASGEGARVHAPSPVGINFLAIHGISLMDANRAFDPSLVTPLARFDTNIATIQYARTASVKGRHVTFLGMLRGGNTTLKSLDPEQNASSSGFSDPFIGASINLKGLPPMTLEEFRVREPETTVDLLLGLTLPLGEYDSENAVNLGSNRWALRIGVPVVHPVSWIEGKQTTLELIPNLHIFTENKDKQLKQDPLFTLEGHASQDFTNRLWGALGFLYTYGGSTKIRGVTQNGAQESLALSLSVGYEVSRHWRLYLRYGDSVWQNKNGLKGSLYHLKMTTRF